MVVYKFVEMSLATLQSIVKLQSKGVDPELWPRMRAPVSEQERQRLNFLTSYLLNTQIHRMNEATVWARAIYPLLMMAERPGIQAWAQVELKAQYPAFSLEGTVDGVLANSLLGDPVAPFLIVTEAKRGTEGKDPQYQLYAQMLAAAWLNHQEKSETPQEIFGCYTISDSWTFACGLVSDFETEQPVMTVSMSREYAEKTEAEAILQILKFISGKYSLDAVREEPLAA